MKVTVNDIARRANVSQSTVSRVLNNHPYIRESTRQRVLEAIEELDFSIDSNARSLITGRTNTIGLIIGDISNPYFAESAKIIIDRAREMGLDVIVSNTSHDDKNLEDTIKAMMSKRVDGLLISSSFSNCAKIAELYESGFPVVLFINALEIGQSNYVMVDNAKGIRLAVDHLVQFGHKRIALISGPMKYSAIHERYETFQSELAAHGLPIRKEFVSSFSLNDRNAIYHFVSRILSMKDAPTAILATSDQMAFIVLDVASSQGIQVPSQLSVIGFDDISLSSNQFIGLTTISQKKEKMALQAIENLVLLMEQRDLVKLPLQVTLDPELIIRRTTGRAM